VVEALEPRLLYSADLGPSLLGAVVSPVAEQRMLESAPQAVQPQAGASQTQAREVVFVDAATPDAERLLAGIAAQPGRSIDVVRIAADEDGLARIGAELAARQDVSAVHIISHGSDGAVYLGRSVLDLQSLEARAGELAAWSGSLTADADVLIYGCDVAQSGAGQALVERLAAVTGADVAASTNLTGTAALGGDFDLEFRSGAVEAQSVLNEPGTLGWQGLLAVTADTSSSAATDKNVAGLTWSHTVSASGSDGFLLVSVGTVNGAESVTSVTYGGTALTRIGGVTEATGKVSLELWYLKAPTAGTADVVVNLAGVTSVSAGATTFFGVDQSTPYSTTAFAEGGGGAVSVTLASAPGELAVDAAAGQAISTFTVGADQTVLWSELVGDTPKDPWNASSSEAGAASVTMSWTKTGSGVGHWASGALSLRPAGPNTAPVLTGADPLASIAEDASGNSGTSVSSLIAGHMTDADAGAVAGIAVTAVDGTNGTWQYSTDAGANWSNFGAPTDASARLLAADANTYVRFVPNPDWSGTVAAGLTFRGWDRTAGIAGDTADASANGGNTAFSAASATSGITVIAVNDAPAGASNTVTTVESSAFVFSAGDFGFTDADGNALAAVKIASLPTAGTLTDNGIAVTAGQFVSAADLTAGLLRFTPAAGASGAPYASFTFQVQDDGGSANGGADLDPVARTMTVNVAPVNNAPVLSGANDLGTIVEDSAANGGTLVADLISGHVTDADSGASVGIAAVGVDNTNGVWQYSLDAGASWSSFGSPSTASARLLAADASTCVRFVPNPGWNGTVVNGLTFLAWDRTSGVSGGTADTTSANLTVRDTFSAVSYANNDGTASWSTSWVDADGNPAAGNARVTGGELVLSTFLGTESVYRQVDLSAASGASLSFSYDNQLGLLGSVSLQASNDGGATYTTLATFSSANPGSGTYTADLSAYLAQDTRVRLDMSGLLLGGSFHVDNVEIAYTTPLSGGATAFSASSASSGITVAAVNDAPAGVNNTVTTLEDTAYVFAAADFGFSDTDGNAITGVKIAALPGAGTLTNSGVAVSAGQTVSAADIASGLLRFTAAPNANGAGYATFAFQVQDDGGTANGGLDLDPTARTMTVNVSAVNDAPLGKNASVTTLEDTAYVFAASDFGFTDPDGNALVEVRIASLPAAGVLTNNGVAVSSGQLVSAADIAAGLLRFTPAPDANGAGYASFGFQVRDNGGTANGGVDFDPAVRKMTVDVIPVNDAPSGANNSVTTLEDTAYVFATADFGFADVDGGALTAVRIASLPASGTLTNNGAAVTAGQYVSAADIGAGLLRFTPAPNANGAGYATFAFQVRDDGGTANGGVAVDPIARTMTVNVTAVNDAPSGTNSTVTILEDTAYVFAAGDFGFGDTDPNAFAAVKITALPASGTLTDNGVAVSTGQSVSAADIAAGLLRFTPAAGANGVGYASFTFQVQDDGGTTNGGVDVDPVARTMTVNVTAVNDAPSGANNSVTALEDGAYVFAASDFGFSDVDGDALGAVRIASLPSFGILTNDGVAVTAGQSVSAADIASGLLRFTPAANASGAGYASFTFQVQDDGGTANGGVDLDPSARTMTVNVTAVNDAPSGANNTVTTLEDTAYVFATADFGFADADGGALTAVKIASLPVSGTLTNNGVAVASGQSVSAADIAAGLLRFTPTANANGSAYASFTFQVQDDGGTANGGVEVDPTARTMTVNVAAVNDAPSGANNSVLLQQDSVYVFSVADFGFSDSEGDAFAGVVIAAVPPGGVITDNGAPVGAGQTVSAADIAAGLVRYTPTFGASGSPYASFTFRVQDGGGTANGGADTDGVARTMTINVIPALAVGPGTQPVPPAPVQTQSAPPVQPVATAPSESAPVALTSQTPLAAASARLLLASNDVFGTRVDADEGFRVQVAAAQPVASVFATAQRLANPTPAAVPGFGLSASMPVSDEKQLEFQLFGSTAVSDSAGGSAWRVTGLAGDLDRIRDDMGEQVELEHWASGSIAVGSFGLTVGYVLWLLRGGALLASLLSSLPAWRLIDPLPVLSRVDEEEDLDEDPDAFVSFAEANPPFPPVPEKS
jgi:hypothetical protein